MTASIPKAVVAKNGIADESFTRIAAPEVGMESLMVRCEFYFTNPGPPAPNRQGKWEDRGQLNTNFP
ncbi:hypothetical protein GCM10023155_11720 [Bremerella cremea]